MGLGMGIGILVVDNDCIHFYGGNLSLSSEGVIRPHEEKITDVFCRDIRRSGRDD